MIMRRKSGWLSCILMLTLFLPGQEEEENKLLKRLEYEVNVNVQLIPLFAVDSRGEPVYDLKKEEIRLQADDRTAEIIYFERYHVDEEEVPTSITGAPPGNIPAAKSLRRIDLIILDSLISNKNTMVQTQDIARGIIDEASQGEAFVILECDQVGGLRYVIGPEKDKKILDEAIKNLVVRYIQRRAWLTAQFPQSEYYPDPKAYDMALRTFGRHYADSRQEEDRYRRDVRMFADALKQLKYALKTIVLPKTVFLVSAGPMPGALGNTTTYYRFLEDAAKAINYGGSMLYVINPLKQKHFDQGTDLKFMADIVGGKFISGKSAKDIIKKIKKSTAAYYELAFPSHQDAGIRSRIRLECLRKNVDLITINYSERVRPYSKMDRVEKKMFALNVVEEGSWSRMVARVGRIDYQTLPQEEALPGPAENPPKTAEITIPQSMRDRVLDFFLVKLDEKTEEAKILFSKKEVGEKEIIRFRDQEGLKQYFVIIDPSQPLCIYNQLR